MAQASQPGGQPASGTSQLAVWMASGWWLAWMAGLGGRPSWIFGCVTFDFFEFFEFVELLNVVFYKGFHGFPMISSYQDITKV